jgi:oligopeptide/dipeptide ABC transporter ATP-binding protein
MSDTHAQPSLAPSGVVDPVLSVRDLAVAFRSRGHTVHAVNGISYDLAAGQTLGIVGESGSGKSVSALAMLGILPRAGRIVGGQVWLDGVDLVRAPAHQLRSIRGRDIAMVFQDPMTSLNPVLSIGRQLTEPMVTHLGYSREEARAEAVRLLDRVGISDAPRRLGDYPHQFSGGMRQRVMIAMAVACHPKVLIADEPTTALDVTIQAQILELLADLVRDEGMAMILITHDLGVVAGICERTHVMYAGRFVETAITDDAFAHPTHPYTAGLLASVPRLHADRPERLVPIGGLPPDLRDEPDHCMFAPRCPRVTAVCREQLPTLEEHGRAGHAAACFHPIVEQDR